MAENANPSLNPANTGSLTGLMRGVLDKFLQSVDDCLPAKVVSYDRTSNRATIQPLIMVLTTDDQKVSRAQIRSVPVFQFGAGGHILSFNLKAGDLGWLKATDRDISLFMQSLRTSAPNTLRKHSFEDAVFFPDPMHGRTIAAEDAEHATFQNMNGTTRLAIWDKFFKIHAERGLFISDENGQGEENTIFEVNSTIKASIPWPRMTTAQRNAIPDPQEGMVIWNTDTHGINTYNGMTW